MINRPIVFEIVYKLGNGEYVREAVQSLKFPADSGYLEAKTPTSDAVQVNPLYTSLLQFTGEFDIEGKPIFHGHILGDTEHPGEVYEVVFYNGGFHLVKNDEPRDLTNEVCMKLKIVGDAIQNADMLAPDKPEEAILASVERKEKLPPFVNIKI